MFLLKGDLKKIRIFTMMDYFNPPFRITICEVGLCEEERLLGCPAAARVGVAGSQQAFLCTCTVGSITSDVALTE